MPSQLVSLPFPVKGLDEGLAFDAQKPLTTPGIMNMIAGDPVTGRVRGAQRPGLTKFVDDTIDSSASIQEICHTIGPFFTDSEGQGQLVYSAATGAAWGTLSDAGVELGDGGDASAVYLMSCWDSSGNLYVATRTGATTDTVTIVRSAVDGTIAWTKSVVHGSTSSPSPVMGMLCIGATLYVLWGGTSSYASAIYRYSTTDGTQIDAGAWKSNGGGANDISGTVFTTGTAQSLVLAGNRLVVITRTGTEGTTGPQTIRGDIFNYANGTRTDSDVLVTVSGSTSDQLRFYGVCPGDPGRFYFAAQKRAGASTYTNYVEKHINSSTTFPTPLWSQTWPDSDGAPLGIAYDAKNNRLGVVGANVDGTGHSFAVMAGTDGTTSGNSDVNSVTTWHRIAAGVDGDFRLLRNSSGNNIIGLNSDLTTVDWQINVSDNQDIVCSINTFATVSQPVFRERNVRTLAVAAGSVFRIDNDVVTEVTDGSNALSLRPVVFATSYYPNIFFADGEHVRYYLSSTNTLATWTPTAGSLPVDDDGFRARLICTWQGRIVLSGLPGDAQNWFMSAINDPFDWDYSPATTTEGQAIAGNNADAGEVQDVITALIPYNNDYLIFGADHSILQMTGNPVAGGRLDEVSDITGIAWGRAFTRDPFGNIWFVGSRGGLYRMIPGSKPERISSESIDDRLTDIDMGANIIRLAWDDKHQMLVICITNQDSVATTTHYFYDPRNQGFFPFQFADLDHNPKVVYLYDGDDPDDRVILMGGWDGYVRKLDSSAKSDDGTAIDAYYFAGPIQDERRNLILMNEMRAILSSTSDPVTATVHVGASAEEALSAASHFGARLVAGRSRAIRTRAMGHSLFVKLRNATLGESFSVESIQAGLIPKQGAYSRRF